MTGARSTVLETVRVSAQNAVSAIDRSPPRRDHALAVIPQAAPRDLEKLT